MMMKIVPTLSCHRLLAVVLLAAAFLAASGTSHAATIRTYDLESLCFMSTDIVEATLVRQHQNGQEQWQDTFTATVVNTIAGQYRPGDQITGLDLELYDPAVTGQSCILFLQRKQFYFDLLPSTVIPARVADMLLIDSRGRVRRYFQWMDPGGLVAEGMSPFRTGLPGGFNFTAPESQKGTDEQSYPTVSEERRTIAADWAAVNLLQPLLSHDPRPEDIPVLLSLLRQRRSQRAPSSDFGLHDLEDGLAQTICRRLSSLRDPAVALDAMAAEQDSSIAWLSGLTTEPFSTDTSVAYARSVLTDPQAAVARRLAAVEVLQDTDTRGPLDTLAEQQDKATFTAVALADETPEPLRLALIPHLDLTQPTTADGLRRLYHQTHSEEVQFATEKAFDFAPDDPTGALYDSLKSACGNVISIVRLSTQQPERPGFVSLASEMIRTKATNGLLLAHDYLFTDLRSGRTFRVDMRGCDTAGDEIEEQQVPLPKASHRGLYEIALEFRENGRPISVGHPLTMMLP